MKRISRREFMGAAAAVAGGAVLAGCAAPTPQVIEKIVKETVVVQTEKVVKETVQVKAAEKGLRFWLLSIPSEPGMLYFYQQGQAKARELGYTMDVETIPGNFQDIAAKVAAGAEAGTLPDIFSAHILTTQFVAQGRLLKIDDIYKKIGEEGGGWHPIADRLFKDYAFDDGLNPAYMHIRKDLVEEHGYTLPFKDQAQMLEWAKKATKPAENFYALGFCMSRADDNYHFNPWMWAYGGSLRDKDGNLTVNSPETIAGMQSLTDYHKVHKVVPPGAVGWDASGNNQAYLSGAVGAILNPGSVLAAARRKESSVDKLLEKTALISVPEGVAGLGPQCYVESGRAYGVNAKTPAQDACKAILTHLWTPKNYILFMKAVGGFFMPTLQGIYKDDFFVKDAWNKQIIDTIMPYGRDDTWPAAKVESWLYSYSTWMGGIFLRILQDGWTAKDAVAEAEKILKDTIAKSK